MKFSEIHRIVHEETRGHRQALCDMYANCSNVSHGIVDGKLSVTIYPEYIQKATKEYHEFIKELTQYYAKKCHSDIRSLAIDNID